MTPCFTDVNTTTSGDCMRWFLAAMNEQQAPLSISSAATYPAAAVPAASNVQYPLNVTVPTAFAPRNMPPPGVYSSPDDVNQVK